MNKFYFFFTLLLVTVGTNSFSQWKPGDPIIDSRDGQTYKTVKIGNQVWMAENLNIGQLIPTTKQGYEMHDDGLVEKYCWDNVLANCDGSEGLSKLGGFYEWKEAMNYPKSAIKHPVQGICPEGWHLPNNLEWNTLLNYLGGNQAYKKMVVDGGSGFDAIMTGYRCTMTGSFRISAMAADKRTYFWSADEIDVENTGFIEIGMNSLQTINFSKSVGLCVRCIMNEIPASINQNEVLDNPDIHILISPNPAFGQISIDVKSNLNAVSQINIGVYNSLGLLVLELYNGLIPSSENLKFELKNGSFLSGFYYLKVASENETRIAKFMIVK